MYVCVSVFVSVCLYRYKLCMHVPAAGSVRVGVSAAGREGVSE